MKKSLLTNRLIALMLFLLASNFDTSAQANQWNYLGCPGMAYASTETKMAVSSTGEPYVVSTYNKVLTVKKFDGYSWQQVGASVYDVYYSGGVDITLDKNDIPYVLFRSYVGSAKHLFAVKKFVGNSWVTIKEDTVSYTYSTSIESDANNNIYVAYKRSGTSNRGVYVEKYSNNSWTIVGGAAVAGFNDAFYPKIGIDKNNDPVLAYRDQTAGSKLSVYRFDGTNWNTIGSAGFTTGQATSYFDMGFDKNNVPYVALRESIPGVSTQLNVMRYNGTNWVNVGNTSAYTPYYISMVLDSNNAPVIAFNRSVSGIGAMAYVIRYDGNNWNSLTTAGQLQYGYYIQLGLDQNNRMHLGHSDKNANNGVYKYSVVVYDSTAKYPKIRPNGPTTLCSSGSVVLSIQSCGRYDTQQWYVNGTAINGATSDVYTATSSGNFTVGITSGGTTTFTDPLAVSIGSSSVSISSVLSSNTYTGGNANTIYLGYGPQSATLTANGTGSSSFTYSWSPAAGLSCTNCQSPVFAPTAAGNYTYTVTSTSAEGCTNTATISFCVLDVRDIKNNSTKIYVCHNGKTNSISASAVATHLSHGDALGMCEQSCNSAAKGGKNNGAASEQSLEDIAVEDALQIYPNPNNGVFTIKGANLVEGGTIVIRDITGKQIEHQNVNADTQMQLTLDNVADGIYILEVHNGEEVYRERIVIKK